MDFVTATSLVEIGITISECFFFSWCLECGLTYVSPTWQTAVLILRDLIRATDDKRLKFMVERQIKAARLNIVYDLYYWSYENVMVTIIIIIGLCGHHHEKKNWNMAKQNRIIPVEKLCQIIFIRIRYCNNFYIHLIKILKKFFF